MCVTQTFQDNLRLYIHILNFLNINPISVTVIILNQRIILNTYLDLFRHRESQNFGDSQLSVTWLTIKRGDYSKDFRRDTIGHILSDNDHKYLHIHNTFFYIYIEIILYPLHPYLNYGHQYPFINTSAIFRHDSDTDVCKLFIGLKASSESTRRMDNQITRILVALCSLYMLR